MDRRTVLRHLTAGAALPALASLTPERLLALGRRARARHGALLVLDPAQAETVATIAEHIIPATDTPGARAAGVERFADLLLAERYDAAERDRFLAGLADVDARSRGLFGVPFTTATAEQQVRLLQTLEAEALERRALDPDAPRAFFAEIKWLTLYGYYTSELGQTQELHAAIIPGSYNPCMTIVRAAPGGGD